MKKTLCLVLSASIFLGCAPDVIVKARPESGKRLRVAVLPFKGHPASPTSGETATEAFSTYILKVKAYDVVDRGAMEQVLKEQKLGMTGALDQKTAAEIGKLLGADAIIVGSVTDYKQQNWLIFPPAKVSITARLIDTKTGLVDWTANDQVGGTKAALAVFYWPILFFTPNAEDQIQRVARRICRSLERQLNRG